MNDIILHQVPEFHFDCGPQDAKLLRAPENYNRYFRVMGIKTKTGMGCSSLGSDLLLPDLPSDTPIGQGFGLTTTGAMHDTEQELLVYFRSNGNTAYWILDSSWIREIINLPCRDCFYIEFLHHAPGSEGLVFERGNPSVPKESHVHFLSVMDTQHQVEQKLWFGKKLDDYAREKIFVYGLPLSILLGVLLAGAYWLYLSYHSSLKSMLQRGIARQEFIPFYQPIVDINQGKIVGYEVLVRWKKGKEFIPPAAFVEHAEACGLIIPITESLLQQVLQQLPELENGTWVSINLVAEHLEQAHVSRVLQQHNWPEPDRLKFEITERLPIADIDAAKQEIARLTERGYSFKIDDFGTGYGGFKYIQALGIDSIKIDKMFTDTIGTNDLKRGVLDAIIAFGMESELEMIVEGVETAEQVEYLKKRGIFLLQGYYFARPMPVEQLKTVKSGEAP
ncbi:EAL domain-containing protein [Shewanella algae]|nr:EAL domain-containing protein [Shewanella algae]